MQIFSGILITAISYLIYPFFRFKIFFKNKHFTKKRIKIELILNSIFVCTIYLILQYILYGNSLKVNFSPALLYYLINVALYKNKNNPQLISNNKNNIENKENDKRQESLENNYKPIVTKTDIEKSVQQQNRTNDNNNKKYIIPLIILIITISLLTIIILLLISNEKKRLKIIEHESKISSIKSNKEYYENLSKELQSKINFYDKYIVIIPQGSNYYMSYDCWNKKGRSDTFKIMNYKDAQDNGYIEYTCNIRDNLGLSE